MTHNGILIAFPGKKVRNTSKENKNGKQTKKQTYGNNKPARCEKSQAILFLRLGIFWSFGGFFLGLLGRFFAHLRPFWSRTAALVFRFFRVKRNKFVVAHGLGKTRK